MWIAVVHWCLLPLTQVPLKMPRQTGIPHIPSVVFSVFLMAEIGLDVSWNRSAGFAFSDVQVVCPAPA